MKITIEPTPKLADFDGVQCRLWNGVSDAGVEVYVFVHRIAVPVDPENQEKQAPFERELKAMPEPTVAIPLRHIL